MLSLLLCDTYPDCLSLKLTEIVAGANAIKAALQSKFGDLEANTWLEQGAGAWGILANEADVKTRWLACCCRTRQQRRGQSLVEQLAQTDGTGAQSFAARVVVNADTAQSRRS